MRTAKKVNGGKPLRYANCPHSEDCAAPVYHSEVMAQLDNVGQSVGLLLEHYDSLVTRVEQVAAEARDFVSRVEQVHSEALDHRLVVTECNAQIVEALRRVEKKLEATDA